MTKPRSVWIHLPDFDDPAFDGSVQAYDKPHETDTEFRQVVEDSATTWIDRLAVEEKQISERLTKLEAFIETESFRKLPAKQRTWLNMQQAYMRAYWSTVAMRLSFAQSGEADPKPEPGDT